MKKHTLGVAVAGMVLMAAMGVSAASAAGAGPGQLRMADSTVVPDGGGYRFLVKHRAGAVEMRDGVAFNRALGTAAARAGIDRAVLASARSDARPAAKVTLLRRMGLQGWSVVRTSRHLDAQEAARFMQELQADPSVERVVRDQMRTRLATVGPMMVPTDPDYAKYQWNFSNPKTGVQAPAAWEMSAGEGVVVAVLDTGVVQGLSDLQNNVIPGYDMISDKRVSRRDSDERVAGGWDMGDWVEKDYCKGWAMEGGHAAEASSWHGSHVSGTIAQETNNGVGVAGLAHKAKVMPVRVLGSCGGMDDDIADAIIWAVGGEVPGLPRNETPAEVLNLSLGGRSPEGCPAVLQEAFDFAAEKGAVVVVAAGNSNGDAQDFTMSSCKNVISVGASRITGGRAGYSNYGARVDLAAPGGDQADGNPNGGIWQMMLDSDTTPTAGKAVLGGYIGTSMASPHVAAAAAMVQSVVETPLTPVQMRDLLKRTATPFPVAIPTGKPIGAGILNVEAALAKALEKPCDPAVETCGPDAVALTNKVPLAGLAGGIDSETLYSFQAKAGQVLTLMTYGGWGDVSLYARFDKEPTTSAFDARSTRGGNSETIRITAPKEGTYYIKLMGKAAYGDVILLARQ